MKAAVSNAQDFSTQNFSAQDFSTQNFERQFSAAANAAFAHEPVYCHQRLCTA
jgi:hypothetical protein